jgi:nitrite reductase/ring-hydroxylating ferredoxin subunit
MKVSRNLLMTAGLAVLLVLTACAAPATAAPAPQGGPIPGTWVDVEVDGDTVSLPLALVEQHVNTHFSLVTGGRELAFMAYTLNGAIHVRANACPPCRSRGFALDGNILVCDACATTFKAGDGSGIAGACVDYPKAAAQNRIVDGAITMSLSDLVAAYDETLVKG